jgi:hypothetical protein
MTTTTETLIAGLTDAELLDNYESGLATQESYKKQIGYLEMEIYKRFEDSRKAGAQVPNIPSDEYTCEYKPVNHYNQEVLLALRELLTAFELETCLIPREPRCDIRKLKSIARRNVEVQDVLDRATSESPSIKFERRS